MKFEVGDLVRNYIGDLLITVDAGFEDEVRRGLHPPAAWSGSTSEWKRGVIGATDAAGKACKFPYATFHKCDGQEYTIWAHHANWEQHKVVTKAKK
tara:strand:+ start:425 stop:712 length:288 start_codon:yes stop_codon:yes gene_type:complete